MRLGCWRLAGLTGVMGVGLLPSAWGQVGRGVDYSRPAEQAPSSIMGRIGGRYTRGDVAVSAPIPSMRVLGPQEALGLPSRGTHGANYTPASVRLGPVASTYRGSLMPALGGVEMWRIMDASGYRQSTRLDTPVGGWGPLNLLPTGESALVAPEPAESRFHELLGLVPARAGAPSAEPMEFEAEAMAVEQGTKEKLARRVKEALALFREGTRASVDLAARQSSLRRASALLANVRKLDEQDPVPCIVLGQVALERGQEGACLNNLIAAASRRAETFRDGPSPATYYGDFDEQTGRSQRFEQQVRRYLRTASEGNALDGTVLEAYCAWALGDKPRARAAIARAKAMMLEGTDGSKDIKKLIDALQYAL